MTPAIVWDVFDRQGRWWFSAFTANDGWGLANYGKHLPGYCQARVVA